MKGSKKNLKRYLMNNARELFGGSCGKIFKVIRGARNVLKF
ncbi:hypothetical protein [Helicobacter pametensis]|nr:hypothetical protein [Helicobacter pametensis]